MIQSQQIAFLDYSYSSPPKIKPYRYFIRFCIILAKIICICMICEKVTYITLSLCKKKYIDHSVQFSLSVVSDTATPWTAALQVSLSITSSQSFHKLMSIQSVMPSNHLILCRPYLFLPSIFPSIRVFSNESVLRIRWPKYWNFSFSIVFLKSIQD